MKTKDSAPLLKAVAAVVKDYVGKALVTVEDRMKALETRPVPIDGKDGAPGSFGERGLDGAPGPVGSDGKPGAQGPAGERGVSGEKGADGVPGPAGERGPEGPLGRDGRDGLAGVPGQPGEKGIDGKHGIDGKDGLGFDDLSVLHDGERGVTFRFQQGERAKEFSITIPAEIYRGVWTEKVFERGDCATWAGSEWHCNETTATKPGDGSKAWTLKVKRGRDGKDGRDGHDRVPVVKVGT